MLLLWVNGVYRLFSIRVFFLYWCFVITAAPQYCRTAALSSNRSVYALSLSANFQLLRIKSCILGEKIKVGYDSIKMRITLYIIGGEYYSKAVLLNHSAFS